MNQAAQAEPVVHIRHFRLSKEMANGDVANNGGATIAYQETKSGVQFAVAYCNPKDNFHRVEGRNRAQGRLNSSKFTVNSRIGFDEFQEGVDQVLNNKYHTNDELAMDLAFEFGADVPAVYLRK